MTLLFCQFRTNQLWCCCVFKASPLVATHRKCPCVIKIHLNEGSLLCCIQSDGTDWKVVVCVVECSHYSRTVRNQDETFRFKLVSGWQRGVKSHQILLNPFRALRVSALFIVAGRYVRMLLRHGESSLCEWNHSASVSVSCLHHSACIAATLALLPSAHFDWDQQKEPSLSRGGIFEVTVQIW